MNEQLEKQGQRLGEMENKIKMISSRLKSSNGEKLLYKNKVDEIQK